jgi:hypothetical protein
MSRITRLKDASIALGALESRVISFAELNDARAFGIQAPAVLAEVITLYVTTADDPSAAASVWAPWNNGVADVLGPVAAKATSYPEFCFTGLKLVADGAVAAERVFGVTKLSA